MKITWLGHASVLLEGSKTVLIDPFFHNNPSATTTVEELPPIDVVLCTHDHFDHAGDLLAVCQKKGATFVGQYELTERADLKEAGVSVVGMNIGGTYNVDDSLSVTLTPAVHSSTLGSPTGVIVTLDGNTVYHAGDTEVFSDMALIGSLHGPLDVALLPVGGHFTMNVAGASHAVELLKPRVVIPIHYNTWPPIAADPQQLAPGNAQLVVLQPGDSHRIGE